MSTPFASRGGEKLEHALNTFGIDPAGLVCADLGASTGGFTDCLLRRGAARVYSVDTGYGILDWRLRNDPRVVVMERANALHTDPPGPVLAAGGLDLAVIDLGWTRQRLALPAAARWLGASGRVVTLIKPHYEREGTARRGEVVLDDGQAAMIAARVLGEIAASGWTVLGSAESPIRGGKGKRAGNREWLAALGRGE